MWFYLFSLELPLCLATCAYWVLRPADYARAITGVDVGPAAGALLQPAAIVVFCAYFVFYARMLWQRPMVTPAFVWLQQAMALGDVLVLATSALLHHRFHPRPATLAAQVGMASFWLATRLVFLYNSRR